MYLGWRNSLSRSYSQKRSIRNSIGSKRIRQRRTLFSHPSPMGRKIGISVCVILHAKCTIFFHQMQIRLGRTIRNCVPAAISLSNKIEISVVPFGRLGNRLIDHRTNDLPIIERQISTALLIYDTNMIALGSRYFPQRLIALLFTAEFTFAVVFIQIFSRRPILKCPKRIHLLIFLVTRRKDTPGNKKQKYIFQIDFHTDSIHLLND